MLSSLTTAVLPPAQMAAASRGGALQVLPLVATRYFRTHSRFARSPKRTQTVSVGSSPASPIAASAARAAGRAPSPAPPVRNAAAAAASSVSPMRMRRVMQSISMPAPVPRGLPSAAPMTDDGDAAYSTAQSTFQKQPGAALWTAEETFGLELGDQLPELSIAYETWGQLNKYVNACARCVPSWMVGRVWCISPLVWVRLRSGACFRW